MATKAKSQSARRAKYGDGSIRDRNGVFYVRYRVGGRQIEERVGRDPAAAEMRLTEVKAQKQQGRDIELAGTLFGNLAVEWLARKRREKNSNALAPTTFERYEQAVRNHLLPAFENDYLHQIDEEALEAYRDQKLAGSIPVAPGSAAAAKQSAQSVTHHLNILSSMFKLAITKRWVSSNPVRAVRRPIIEHADVDPLEADEVKSLLGLVQGQDRLLLRTLVVLGLRIGECLALQHRDYNPRKKTLLIRRTLRRDGGKITLDPVTKTEKGKRTLVLSDGFAEKLEAQIESNKSRPDPDGLKLIFRNSAGRAINPSNFRNRVVRPAFLAIGRVVKDPQGRPVRGSDGGPVGSGNIHLLRHTYASQAIEDGIAPFVLSRRMGHSSTRITLDRYTHLFEMAMGVVADNDGDYGFED